MNDNRGYALIEAAILFPIIFMIFAGLILLSIYLPTRANLQRATQYAATAMATEKSDTWLIYDAASEKYTWLYTPEELGANRNVYRSLFRSAIMNPASDRGKVETIVSNVEKQGIYLPAGNLIVTYTVTNAVLYQEVHVTATRTITPPVNLSYVGFPAQVEITVTSSAVVRNGDEFVRNVDLAKDLTDYLSKKFGIDDIFTKLDELGDKFNNFFGI